MAEENPAARRQTAVAADLKSKQLLLFSAVCICIQLYRYSSCEIDTKHCVDSWPTSKTVVQPSPSTDPQFGRLTGMKRKISSTIPQRQTAVTAYF